MPFSEKRSSSEPVIEYEFVKGMSYDRVLSQLNYQQRLSIKVNSELIDVSWIEDLCRGVSAEISDLTPFQRELLEELAERQLLRFGVIIRGKRRLVLNELATLPEEIPRASTEDKKLCRFTMMRLTSEGPCLTNPRARCSICLLDDVMVNTAVTLMKASPVLDRENELQDIFLRLLDGNQFLAPGVPQDQGALDYWEEMDLAFHSFSQRRPLLKSGATYRNKGNLPPLINRTEHSTGTSSAEGHSRKTTRVFGENFRLKKDRVTEFLVRSLTPIFDGEIHWPWPAPGGIYNYNFYLLVNELEDISPGVYRFDLKTHHLVPIMTKPRDRLRLSQRTDCYVTNGTYPPLILILTADFPLLSQVYEKIAYRLQLITTGCVLQVLYQWAPQFGLGIRPIGGSDNQLIEEELLKLEANREISLLYVEVGALPGPQA